MTGPGGRLGSINGSQEDKKTLGQDNRRTERLWVMDRRVRGTAEKDTDIL